MMKLLEDFPANIVAVVAQGQVTKKDYEEVLIPAAQKALKGSERVRIYYEFDPSFTGMDPGAMWEDFTFGVTHLMRWEKVAVVTDVPWVAQATNAFRFMMPCPVGVFSRMDAQKARIWVSEKDEEEKMAAQG